MRERDKARFHDNITWFNQFFDGIREIFENIVDQLPVEFFQEDFALTSSNFYFPRHKAAPSMPPYYALMLEGRMVALQVVAVIDANLFTPGGPFIVEPSLITVIHDQTDKYGWINDFALNVIRNQNVELTSKEHGSVWGKFTTKFPADFFAFQVQYDKFSDNKNPKEAVRQYIIDPIFNNLDMSASDTTENG
jgi:hypothetical protein